jgi:hypothetical protein
MNIRTGMFFSFLFFSTRGFNIIPSMERGLNGWLAYCFASALQRGGRDVVHEYGVEIRVRDGRYLISSSEYGY